MVVARFWLVVVFEVVPLGVSYFLSCRVGGYFVARWSVGTQANCSDEHSATSGGRVMRAQLVFSRSGACCMGANAVVGKSTFLSFFQNNRAPPGNRR